jgi:hypothetical protein
MESPAIEDEVDLPGPSVIGILNELLEEARA